MYVGVNGLRQAMISAKPLVRLLGLGKLHLWPFHKSLIARTMACITRVLARATAKDYDEPRSVQSVSLVGNVGGKLRKSDHTICDE